MQMMVCVGHEIIATDAAAAGSTAANAWGSFVDSASYVYRVYTGMLYATVDHEYRACKRAIE